MRRDINQNPVPRYRDDRYEPRTFSEATWFLVGFLIGMIIMAGLLLTRPDTTEDHTPRGQYRTEMTA